MSKRYGFRSSYIAGSIMLVAGQVLAGFAVELWQLFLTQGVLFGFGLGFIMVSTNPVLSVFALTPQIGTDRHTECLRGIELPAED